MTWSFTLRVVLLGAAILGFVGGVIGAFALLRRQSLLSDSIAHATLPGVGLAFVITGSKAPFPLLAGAAIAGILGALTVLAITRSTRIKDDAAMGVVLSVYFGLGIVLLTWIQKLPGGNQSGLDRFLFGQSATLLVSDVAVMSAGGVVVLTIVAVLFKEFALVSFDRGYAASLGLPVKALEVGLTGLLVAVVVLGLQLVGAVLVVATLLVPPAAARQWTNRLGTMLLLSGAIGAVSGATGALLSASFERLPTGPTIVLVASAAFAVSLLFAPRRGVLYGRMKARRVAARVRRENLLKDVYRLGEDAGNLQATVTSPALMGLRGRSASDLQAGARALEAAGLVLRDGGGLRLTPHGLETASSIVRKHRLWEMYLAKRLELALDHVHRDAESMEHALSDEAADELDRLLGNPETDPHGRPIPRAAN